MFIIKSVKKYLSKNGFYIALIACISLSITAGYLSQHKINPGVITPASGTIESSSTYKPLPSSAPFSSPQSSEVPAVSIVANVPTPTTTIAPSLAPTASPTPSPKPTPTSPSAPPKLKPPVVGILVKGFSLAPLYSVALNEWRSHTGVDLAATVGENVCAAADGVVSKVEENNLYGWTVVVDHGHGTKTTYSNLDRDVLVAVGNSVFAGTVIGHVGDSALCETGEATHLHFSAIKDGAFVNPVELY